jgi:hypothetical protein
MPAKQGIAYLGNALLKGPGVKIEYSKEQMEEYVKCSEDLQYFLTNYFYIRSLDKGPILFDLYDYQKRFLKEVRNNRFTICKFPRQTGKTSCVTGDILHMTQFTPDYKVAVLANKQKTATEILDRIKLAYERLPMWLKQGVVEWNKTSIKFENGSKIIASSTSATAVRGDSFNYIMLDEFAFVPNNIADEFFASVYPTISSGKTSKVVIVSTPKGMNMYYKIWKDALAGRNPYKAIEVKWWEVPGRDEAWKETTKKALGSDRLWLAEYECEFLGSEDTLIRPTKLSTLVYDDVKLATSDGLNIYKEPEKDHIYAMTVDTSRALGLDYHAFVVIDVTKMPYQIVARFRNNIMPVMLVPNMVASVGARYNDAYILVEMNDTGQQVSDILHEEMEYENLVTTTIKGKKGQRATGFGVGRVQYGVKMSNQIKKTGCLVLKELVENDKIILTDFDVISELSTFVSEKASYAASEGYNDDLVSCLVMFGWLTTQSYFRDLVNTNIRRKLMEEKIKKMEEDLLPFGFLSSEMDNSDQDAIDLGRESKPKNTPQYGDFNDSGTYGGW